MVEQKHITPADFRRADAAPLPNPNEVRLPGTEGPAQYFVNYVKRPARRGGVRRADLRRRPARADVARPRRPAGRRDAISKWLDEAGRSGGRARRDRSARRPRAGDDRRQELPRVAVQSRGAGQAAGGLVLQAVRARHGTRARDRTRVDARLTADRRSTPAARSGRSSNYEGSYLGTIDLQQATIHSDNTRLRAAHAPRRPAEHRPHGPPARDQEPAAARTSRSASARRRVNPLEMARAYSAFANGGFRVDGSISAQHSARDRRCRRQGRGRGRLHEAARQLQRRRREARARCRRPRPTVTSILQGVVREGTGVRAALPDRVAAGKTGTTENYGDAWFVGYTPQLVVAVWVGYPDKLVPMTTQFHGDAVAGGTYPAMIWKTFMERALKFVPGGEEIQYFDEPPSLYGDPATVLWREDLRTHKGSLQLDNGHCREAVDARSSSRGSALQGGELQAERGRGAERRRQAARGRADSARRAAAHAILRLQACEARAAARHRPRRSTPGSDGSRRTTGDARRSAFALRSRPERRRARAAEGATAAAQGGARSARRPLRRRQGRPRGRADAARRSRGGTGHEGVARGRARLSVGAAEPRLLRTGRSAG